MVARLANGPAWVRDIVASPSNSTEMREVKAFIIESSGMKGVFLAIAVLNTYGVKIWMMVKVLLLYLETVREEVCFFMVRLSSVTGNCLCGRRRFDSRLAYIRAPLPADRRLFYYLNRSSRECFRVWLLAKSSGLTYGQYILANGVGFLRSPAPVSYPPH